MAFATGGGDNIKAEPNVTPMIDVMLVLLIIFMLVVPAINAGFQAVPPQGVNLKSHPEEDTDQVLGIDKDGQYYLNKRPIRNESLEEQLTAIYGKTRPDYIMYLKADKNLDYQKVLDAIDIAAKSGVKVTGMITDQQNNTTSTVAGDNPVAEANAKGSR